MNILTVPVSVFVDSETEARILEALNKLDKNRFRLEFASHMGASDTEGALSPVSYVPDSLAGY